MAYAFGLTPGKYRQCYELIFTGEGRFYSLNNKKMAGKKIIIKTIDHHSSFLDIDFEIMVPGGGGGFDFPEACSNLLGVDLGKEYGGFLSMCYDEVGYEDSDIELYVKRKQCLTKKCNDAFIKYPDLLKGCLFLSDWMEALDFPTFEYKEVSCPDELKDKY